MGFVPPTVPRDVACLPAITDVTLSSGALLIPCHTVPSRARAKRSQGHHNLADARRCSFLHSVVPCASDVELPCRNRGEGSQLVKENQGLEDVVELLVHDLEGSVHLAEIEGVGRQQGRVHPFHLQQAQQTLHAQPAACT